MGIKQHEVPLRYSIKNNDRLTEIANNPELYTKEAIKFSIYELENRGLPHPPKEFIQGGNELESKNVFGAKVAQDLDNFIMNTTSGMDDTIKWILFGILALAGAALVYFVPPIYIIIILLLLVIPNLNP